MIGAHYQDHFTLVLLHGLCLNPHDPQCKVGSLYPVSCARKVLFEGNRPTIKKGEEKSKRKEQLKRDFSEGQGRFCKAEFPETYKSWEQAVQSDPKVRHLIEQSQGKLKIDPKFERDAPLTVAYSTIACAKMLGGDISLGATFAKNQKDLEKYQVKAVNLDGCVLSEIEKCGRKNNIGVVLAIKDVCGKVFSLPSLQEFSEGSEAIRNIVANFARAVVVAGLPKVYPSVPDEEDRIEIECVSSSDEDDNESSDEDKQPATSGATTFGESGTATSNSSSETAPRVTGFSEMKDKCGQQPTTSGASSSVTPPMGITVQIVVKEGSPEDHDLHELANDVSPFWRKLGRELKVEKTTLDQIDLDNRDDSYEKAYQMLMHWKESNEAATYKILFEALGSRVSRQAHPRMKN